MPIERLRRGTYIAKLNAGVCEALAGTKSHADVSGHVRGGSRGLAERATTGTLSDTSNIGPTGGEGSDGVNKPGGREGVARRGSREVRANRVAAGEGTNRGAVSTDILVDNLALERASGSLVLVDVGSENLAGVDITVHVVAVINGVLENGTIPTHQEVGVVGEEVRVASGKDVGTFTPIVEAADGNDLLVEDCDGVDRVTRGARSAVEVVHGVSHMRLMVRTVEIHTIPALREENLETKAVLALVNVGEVDILTLGIGRIVRDSAAIVCKQVYLVRVLSER